MNEDRDHSNLHSEINEKDELTKDHSTDEQEYDKDQHNHDQASEEFDQTEPAVEPLYKVSEDWSIVPIKENVNEKAILLTIDDAPDEYALDMAKTLYDLNAGAVFFVNGHLLENEENRNIVKEIYDMGFIIGNHTYSHANLTELNEDEQLKEIVSVNDMIEEITGERPTLFRAPFGINTDFSKQVVQDEGMILMNWSYGYDWEKEYMTKESLTDIMLNTNLLSSGSNLLMHDREWTALALNDIVTGLRHKGYDIIDPTLIQTTD